MADNMVEDEFQWLSAELRILEAEYEKSKLRVFQDTLLCKRSMMELELLCKNEQIRKNARANNKIKKHEYQLQEQLESLSTELKNATNQLQTAQNTLQDEKVHHDMEKKKLEDKLNSEMEKRIEEQRESAIHKDNLLQEEIKSWQEKHVKTIKEAEDLRMELSKKNVPVKTKAIQTRVTVEDASTMAQVDLQTCDVGVQVQALSSEDEGFRKADEDVPKNDKGVRKADEDVRKPDEVVRGMDDTGKGRKRVAKAKGKNHIKTTVKDGKSERNKDKNDKRNVKGKRANQSKENERSDKKRQKENPEAERKMKSRSTKQEGDLSANDAMAEHHNEGLRGRAKASNAWLISSVTQENDVPLRYSKTPRRLRKKSDESNQSLEKSCTDKSDMSTCMTEEITASMAEASTSEKHNEDNENKSAVKSNEVELYKEDVHDDKNGAGKKASQQQTVEKQQNHVVMEEDKGFLSLNECQKRLEEKELSVSERENAFEEAQDKKSKSVQNKKEIKQKQKNRKTKKTKEEKVSENKSEDEGDQNKGGRVLRKRTKKQSSGVEMDPCKGQSEDSKKQTYDNHEKATTKKYKTDDICLKGHDSAMLHTSSPEVHQLPRESELSSREIDPLVDEPRPSQGVTSRAIADDTSQQPETDVQEELNGGNNKAAKGERLGDYNSGRGSSDLNYNRIKEVGEKIDQGCLHKALEERKSSRGEDGAKKANTEGKNNKKIDLASAKCRKRKQTGQKLEDIDNTCVSKRQDLDAVDPDNNVCSTKRKAEATFPDAGHSKRKGSQHPAELSVTGCEKTATKENAPNAKTGGKKRKPTSRVRKVLASADQQSCSDATTSTEISSMLDVTKKRKTLFNSRENSLMVPNAKVQISFANTTLSKSRTGAGIPPSLSAFMRSFIAPKLKKPQ